MMRESLYTAGYLGVAPLLKAKLTGHSAFEGTPGAALVVSGVSAGILATLTSHPADTIKTRMQVGCLGRAQGGWHYKEWKEVWVEDRS